MSTLLIYAPALAHTFPNHPESHDRLDKILPILDKDGVLADLTAVSPTLATTAQLQQVHTLGLIEAVRHASAQGGGLLDHGDTYATAESYDLARLAAGSCCTAVDDILTGKARNGFALVRPPGHHAERDRITGFCLFNNVAVAARHAQVVHNLERVMIIDIDVHHGNGTQDIFYQDDSVLFASLHLFAPFFYPGIGSQKELGQAQGSGYTLNVPLPPLVGDVGYNQIVDELIIPKARAFQPELLLISAGFDAHWQDPLATAGLSLTGYAQITQKLVQLAEEVCNSRILFVLEGGYQRNALALGIINTFYALTAQDTILDPIGPMTETERDVTHLLHQLRQQHLLI